MKNRWSRKRRHNNKSNPEIGLTPLIDIAFTLLIIFMVTTPMLKKENALQVELPQGKVKEISDTQKQDLIVSIDKSGKLSFNDKIVSEKKLIETLKSKSKQKKLLKKTIFVKADVNVGYGKVIDIVDKIKQIGGIQYVALATTKVVS